MHTALDFDIFLDMHMVFGKTGIKEFRLHIGKKGDAVDSFGILAQIVEPLLGDHFAAIGFDPERYDKSQMFYSSVVECIKKHDSLHPLIIPAGIEFYNGAGDAQFTKMAKSKARKAKVGFVKVA